MARVWRFAPHDASRVSQLVRELKLSPLVAQVLVARGYHTGDAATEFLRSHPTDLHPPELLPGIPEAVERILAAHRAGRRITIYGDYDVDGVTGTSLLWHCLKLAGANVDYYIPHRLEEGYGLNCEAIRQLHEEDPQRLLVSVDCGICSVEEAALAKSLGLELIITDHHQFGNELPAACLVHPRLPGSTYPFHDLCGAGVAFKLAWGLCQQLGDGKKATPRMRQYLIGAVGLAAIGTVADVVSLTGENRVIVRYGLTTLAEHGSIGLQALMKVASVAKHGSMQAEDVAFAIAPRINAAGRLGQARLAVELLTTDNAERAVALATYLNELNKNRQTVERRIFKQAKELVEGRPEWADQPALVLAHADWHPGVIGIVASRVVERFQKPAVLVALNREKGIGQGSGRTFGTFNLHAALSACAGHLETFGGHAAAAGLRIAESNLEAFREALCEYVGCHHEFTDEDSELFIDAEVRFADLTRRAVDEIDRLGPFGRDNARPVFAASRVELAEAPRRIGEGERHLSVKFRHYNSVMRAVAFGQGEWADEIAAVSGPLSISFAPSINRFNGRETVELRLIDWRPEAAQGGSAVGAVPA